MFSQSNFPALQNSIARLTKNVDRKYEILETQASSNILPPQISSNNLDPTFIPSSEEYPQVDKTNERRNAFSAESEEVSVKGQQPPSTGFEPPKLLPTYNQEFRQREEARLKQLGLPLQPPSQTSQFINQQPKSPAVASQFIATQPKPQFSSTQSQAVTSQTTKKPAAKTFDPDKNFKAFEHIFQPGKKATHKDYDFSRYFTKKENAQTTTAAPVQRRQDVETAFSTTRRSFTNNQVQATTQRTAAPTVRTFVTNTPTTTTTTRRPVPVTTPPARRVSAFNQFSASSLPPTPSPLVQRVPLSNQNSISTQKASESSTLARDLLPPHNEVRNYDDASTKGPAIYYEWKVPDRGLLPPKLDNETDVQSKRSILEEGNFEGDNGFQSSESRRFGHKNSGNSIKIQYKDLQKLFSIPDVEFPIESNGRDGYENAEAVNSFQVKIPYRSGNSDRYYYLEHSHCNPECHPYFFKPGRCEPCIKL